MGHSDLWCYARVRKSGPGAPQIVVNLRFVVVLRFWGTLELWRCLVDEGVYEGGWFEGKEVFHLFADACVEDRQA